MSMAIGNVTLLAVGPYGVCDIRSKSNFSPSNSGSGILGHRVLTVRWHSRRVDWSRLGFEFSQRLLPRLSRQCYAGRTYDRQL